MARISISRMLRRGSAFLVLLSTCAWAVQEAKVTVELAVTNGNQLLVAPASVSLTAAAFARQQNHPIVQVEFYSDGTLIGSTATSPYAALWSNVAAGNYNLTAKATNDKGDFEISAPILVSVDAPPVVSFVTPSNNKVFTLPARVALEAAASDADGTIAKVDFYQGGALVGTTTAAPYVFAWNNPSAGTYSLTAVATDDRGASASSAPVQIIVNAPPRVVLTSPANSAVVSAPGTVTITADATDTDGSIAKVEFYQGDLLVGTATTAPFSVSLANVPSGKYTLTARATDNLGGIAISAPVKITLDTPPAVQLTHPANHSAYAAPATLQFSADATDSDGTIAKMEFFQNGILIGTATTSPYSINWTNVPSGKYTLTAMATDDLGLATTSAPIQVVLNTPPTVQIATPKENQILPVGAVPLTANVSSIDSTIAKVEFYQNNILIDTATVSPYTVNWTNVTSGAYTLTAKAIDAEGIDAISAPVQIKVDSPPSVVLTSPAAGTVGIAPARMALTGQASDSDGTIVKVEFFNGSTLIGTATEAPFTVVWDNIPLGNYSLKAKATDDLGLSTLSAEVNVTVIANTPPSISLTSPAANQSFKAPASITLTANASDPDNNLAKVEFFDGSTLLGTVLSAPYTVVWNNVPQGSYSLTAIATDATGAQTTSLAVPIAVSPAEASVYYIHSDHLGTPRLVTDEQNTVVWRSLPILEPFGQSAPESDPNSTGRPFEFNLRFPGQYFDKESNLHYNYFRDYDPSTGRYVQSDPIGLAGGINTYSYVSANPLSLVDPLGLQGALSGLGLSRGATSTGGLLGSLLGGKSGLSQSTSGTGNPDLDAALGGSSASSSSSGSDDEYCPTPPPEDPCDKKLSQHEIDKLQNGGIDVHAEKEGFGGPPKYFDLYKCKNGDIVVKRKGGGAIVQRTGLNIKNF